MPLGTRRVRHFREALRASTAVRGKRGASPFIGHGANCEPFVRLVSDFSLIAPKGS